MALGSYLPTEVYLPTSSRISLREWIDKAGIILRGKRYSTKGHEYLDAIINDEHPDQTFEKAAQVAISTTILLKSLYVAEHLGKKVVYYFQDDTAVSDFSADRANPMIESSRYLSGRVRGTDRVGLKQIGPGSLYFRGLYSKGKSKSIDCDLVVVDEVDEVASEENIHFAKDRLLHSDLQWSIGLSQPSMPGYGIDADFAETDQFYWNIVCPSCKNRNSLELDFPKNFIPIAKNKIKSAPEGATFYRGCSRCESPLNMAVGEWIAKYPSRVRRGYHLSQLCTQINPRHGTNIASRVMAQYESSRRSQSKLANFQISWLGFPYAGASCRVTDELLDNCTGQHGFSMGDFDAFMGVDQGDVLTIAIGVMLSGRFHFIYFEETELWGRLEFLMDRFGVRYCVIDAQPNKNSAKQFASKYPERVAIQYFGTKELKQSKELYENKIEVDVVSVDRTESLDNMIDRMERGEIIFPNQSKCVGDSLSTLEIVRSHFKKLITKLEPTASGIPRRTYIRGHSVANHFGMAGNSAILAAFDIGVCGGGPMVLPEFYRG